MGFLDKFFKPWEPKASIPPKSIAPVSPPMPPPPTMKMEEKSETVVIERPVFLENSKDRKILFIQYNSQRDNKFSPRSACNVTTIQMGLSRHFSITDDELFLLCNSMEMNNKIKSKYPKDYAKWIYPDFIRKGSANEVFVVLLEAMYNTMDSTRFAKIEWNLTDQKIINEINNGYPFGACGNFVGGHFVLIIGYDLAKKVWIVHDPFGNWLTGYKDTKGAYLEYPMARVKKILYTYGFKIHADKRIPV